MSAHVGRTTSAGAPATSRTGPCPGPVPSGVRRLRRVPPPEGGRPGQAQRQRRASARAAASRPTPPRSAELSERWNASPRRRAPAASVTTPWSCSGYPSRSGESDVDPRQVDVEAGAPDDVRHPEDLAVVELGEPVADPRTRGPTRRTPASARSRARARPSGMPRGGWRKWSRALRPTGLSTDSTRVAMSHISGMSNRSGQVPARVGSWPTSRPASQVWMVTRRPRARSRTRSSPHRRPATRRREAARVAVVPRVQLPDVRVQGPRERGHARRPVHPGREDDLVRRLRPVTAVSATKPPASRLSRLHADPGADGQSKCAA